VKTFQINSARRAQREAAAVISNDDLCKIHLMKELPSTCSTDERESAGRLPAQIFNHLAQPNLGVGLAVALLVELLRMHL
jgi:hypothetical protein